MNLSYQLKALAEITKGELQGGDETVVNFCHDTRVLNHGDTFVTLNGEHFNGEDFIEQAVARGANALLTRSQLNANIPVLKVADTRKALGDIAAYHRQQFKLPVAAITGSCGKTTTRALLASICCQQGATLASIKSFNNDIGVPLTLLELSAQHQFAVLEMGMNHFGELAYLTSIVKPDVALITNIAPVHIEFFKTQAAIAKAKAEIFEGLKPTGTAILNRDNEFYDTFLGHLNGQHHLSFAIDEPQADVRAETIKVGTNSCYQFDLITPIGECHVQLPILGQHNVSNALAAAATALALKIDLVNIKTGLEQAQTEAKRLVVKQSRQGATIIDDSYNANPKAVCAAIDVLCELPAKKTLLVLADMGELGDNEVLYHQQVGQYAKTKGVDQFYAWGELSKHAVDAFGENASHFASREALIAALNSKLDADYTVLIKGSRSTKMECVVAALTEGE